MRIFVATLRKLRLRPATLVTFLLLNLFTLLIVVAIGASARAGDAEGGPAAEAVFRFPAAYRFMIAFVFMNGLLAAAYGAAVAGSEWSWGTLKAAIARGERRSVYVLGTFLGVAAMLAIGALLSVVVAVPSALLGATIGGLPLTGADDTSWLADLPEVLGRGILAFAMECALGFAIATIAKSQIAGIGAVIGLNIAEGIAGLFARDIFQWFPFSAGNALISGGGGGPTIAGFQPGMEVGTAAIVVVAWLVAALGVAALWTERAEISG